MARPTISRQLIPSSSTTPAAATATTTITLETGSSSNQQQPQITDSLVLKLKRPKKKVSWKEGTVDNEFMNKKSSKKCCIFHKEKPFDEDDSDAEGECDHDHRNNGRDSDDKNKHNHGDDGNCCHAP
ncbi:UNVERIFIED_CONTAM: Type 1 phosphatases regulator YPI2 [Sesamum radiatum]|uniref:Type 1 phosphatases regulator YPI2 n=1 Tax=Sesamum radiatum TaxID=300843 RepID=A0AAW2PX75_SESRA